MKKINLKTIDKADKTSIRTKQRAHCVCLHSGLSISFSDMKNAKAFLVKTNDFLNDKMFELIEIQIEIYGHFKRTWYYMNIPDEAVIRSNMQSIDNALKFAVERSSWQNGPHYVWSWMEQICSSLVAMATIIQELNRKKGNYAEIRILQSIISRVENVRKQLQTFPD